MRCCAARAMSRSLLWSRNGSAPIRMSLSETYALKYWWCSPPRTGIASVRPTVWMVRGIGASLCSEAAGHDAKRWLSRGIRATRNLALELFFVGTGALRGCTALKELRHMPRLAGFAGRARGRIAADLGLQLDDVDELVGLAAQLIGDHRRLRRRSEEHTSELQSRRDLVCRLLLEKK